MADILKDILKELPSKDIDVANFEGANIVLYTSSRNFFLTGEETIRKVVDRIKKRVELRATEDILMAQDKTDIFIKGIIPGEAEITNVLFDVQRSIVVIEAKRPGMAIGKGGETLKKIKEGTLWTPLIQRSPVIRSKITETIRHVLYVNDSQRKKFLNSVGKAIYKEWNPEKREEWIRLTFLGGARQVGRSCLLLQTPESKILLDCGIDVAASDKDKFPLLNVPEFDIKKIDAIVLSHAHLDHSGLLPYLYKMGYDGPVYMTAPTRDIAALLALDLMGVSYKKALSPLYSSSDIKEMIKHSICVEYGAVTDIAPDVRLTLYNAGHALGSSMVHLNIGNGLHNLLYTGDMKFGMTEALEKAAINFPRLESVVIESTYGGKDDILPGRIECENNFLEAIKRTIDRKGKVLVPVLGVGRAQEVMLMVEKFIKNGFFPKIPVYVDGMVWDVTAVHTAYPNFLNNSVKSRIFRDENPFSEEIFKRVGSPAERKEVVEGGPCVILATSGMMVGGASVEYFRELADSSRNMLLFVAYQGSGSLGRQVKDGLKEAEFDVDGKKENVKIKLEVVSIDGLSGHSSRNQLMSFISAINPKPKRILVNHGEQSKCLDLASSLYRQHRIETSAPRNLETVRLR